MNFRQFFEMAYPASFNIQEFNDIQSYSKKVKYAADHLKKIGSGSSRVVFLVDDEKVLKIAKNVKGLGQNRTEADWSMQQYGIVAKIFNIGEDHKDIGPMWLEMELAKKVSPKRFKEVTGIALQDVQFYLTYLNSVNNPSRYRTPTIDDQLKETVQENEWMQDLESLILNYDMTYPGDFGRISTYGEVVRDGVPTIVLVDFGLSSNVYYEYYKV
jgi:hypothetical protein